MIKVGLICMQKKAEAKPMKEILKRLTINQDIEIVHFDDATILHSPISEWPIVNIIIAFHSGEYPLLKVQEYQKANNCVCINGKLIWQQYFKSRVLVKEILEQSQIPQPNFMVVHKKREYCQTCSEILQKNNISLEFCSCEIKRKFPSDKQIIPDYCNDCKYHSNEDFDENEECVKFKEKIFQKPFIEKPVNADDHNIIIYYQERIVKLFRKEKDKSSESFAGQYQVRKNGCYLYEEFLQAADNQDVKIYTIYPNYHLCELRKAPHIDGIVERDQKTGKEVRYQTEITDEERKYAIKICQSFHQLIVGFDVLRTLDGRSLVIDVNGFSFVKGNENYYILCAQSLRKIILTEHLKQQNIIQSDLFDQNRDIKQHQNEQGKIISSISEEYLNKIENLLKQEKYSGLKDGNEIQMKALVSVFNHADIAPKFKYSFETKYQKLIEVFFPSDSYQQSSIIKPQIHIQVAQLILNEIKNIQFVQSNSNKESNNDLSTPTVLNEINEFEINEKIKSNVTNNDFSINDEENEGINLIVELIENRIAGTNLKATKIDQNSAKIEIRWGGYLTMSGARQAFIEGQKIRQNYPESQNINLKALHNGQRRVTKTCVALVLGFLTKHKFDELIPQLSTHPYTQSDFICPDLFDFMKQTYNDQIVLDTEYTTEQIKLMLSVDEQVLNLLDDQAQIELQLVKNDINQYFQNIMENEENVVNKSNKTLKHEAVYKQLFDQVAYRLQRCLGTFVSHHHMFLKIYNSLNDIINFIQLQDYKMYFPKIAKQQISTADYFELSNQCISKSFKFILNSFFKKNSQYCFDISKIFEINNLLTFLIVHHLNIFKNDEQILMKLGELYRIVLNYSEKYQFIHYGATQLQKLKVGKTISYNLLENVQQEIHEVYNGARIQDQKIVQIDDFDLKMIESENQQHFSKLASVVSEYYSDSMVEKQTPSTYVEQQNVKIIFYFTNEAHLWTLRNLLTTYESSYMSHFLMQDRNQIQNINQLAQIHFVFTEMYANDYYNNLAKTPMTAQKMKNLFELSQNINSTQIQQKGDSKIQAPHRFLQIEFSPGQTNDIFQPVYNQVMPVDRSELLFGMFPFSNIELTKQQIKVQQADWSLQTIIGVYRHGDRSPKQKLKQNIKNQQLLQLIFDFFQIDQTNPIDYQVTLQTNEALLMNFAWQMKLLINQNQMAEQGSLLDIIEAINMKPPALKLALKFDDWETKKSCQISLKFGGILTELGKAQSEKCAQIFATNLQSDKNAIQTLCNNINVKINDEQRVKYAAIYFMDELKKQLGIQKEIQYCDETEKIFKIPQVVNDAMDSMKKLLNQALVLDLNILTSKSDIYEVNDFIQLIDPQLQEGLVNPLEKMIDLQKSLEKLINIYGKTLQNVPENDLKEVQFMYFLHNYGLQQLCQKQTFNVVKVKEVYDIVRFDALHSKYRTLEIEKAQKEVYEKSKLLNKIIAPSEFGTNKYNKYFIACCIAYELMCDIKQKLEIPGIHLYFVSESHAHALINLLRVETKYRIDQIVDFMAHLIIKVYTNELKEYRIEIYESMGSYQNPFKTTGEARIQQARIVGELFDLNFFLQIVDKMQFALDGIQIRDDLGYDKND